MMKLILLVAVVFVVLWFMRQGRRGDPPSGTGARGAAPPVQQEMVACPVCGVHLPRTDALPGPDGRLYCCAEHRERAGA